MSKKLSPIHPGEVLFEEFLKPMSLSQNRLAIDIGVDARRINEIVLGIRSVTADTARVILGFLRSSGLVYKQNMTWILHRIYLATVLNVK